MKRELLVSVVIVSWNARGYLEKCLETLFNGASRYPMEVLVVDNASADGSPEMVAKKYPQAQLIQTGANLGFAKANNIGIRISSGKYVFLINSDVEVLKDCITKLVDYCESHSQVGMVGPRVTGGDGKLQRSCRGFPTVWNMLCRALALDDLFPRSRWLGGYLMRYWDHATERQVDILSGCFWGVRRDALPSVGLLDESFFMYGEDMDWCKRFWNAGWPLVFVPTAEAIHYGGASSSSAPLRFFIEKQRADLQYWRKHHSWIGQRFYFLVAFFHHAMRVLGYTLLYVLRHRSTEWHYKMVRGFRCLQWMAGMRGAHA